MRAADDREHAEHAGERHHQPGRARELVAERVAGEAHVPVPARHAERPGAHHEQRHPRHAEAEEVRLPLRQIAGEHELAAEQHRDQEVGEPHEGERGADDDGGVEVPRHVDRVVDDEVQLLGAHHHARDAAEEAEADQRDEHRREAAGCPRAPCAATRTGRC